MTRRQLFLLCGAFFVLRLVLVLSAADRLSQPDGAEVKLMQIGDDWVRTGQRPGIDDLLRYAQMGTNAPHGAYLLVSLLYALLVVPVGAEGSYLALKAVGIGFSTLGLAAWTAVALRLGGRRAAAAMALLWSLPPKTFLAGTLVPWGSHAEAPALLGVAAWILVSDRIRRPGDAAAAGLVLGWVAACSLLAAPLVAVAVAGWALDARTDRPGQRLAALAAGGAVGAGGLLAITGGLTASVTETAGSAPLDLVGRASGASRFGQSLLDVVDPVIAAVAPAGATGPQYLGALWMAGWAVALGLAVWQGWGAPPLRGRTATLLAVGPALHVLILCLLAPRRPDIPPRYLLAIQPLLLLAVALAFGRAGPLGSRRGVAAATALALVLLPQAVDQGTLLDPSRIGGFRDYTPARWLRQDIGRVTYATAPGVNRFLDARGDADTQGFNFAAGVGAADDPFASAADPLDPRALIERRDAWLAGNEESPDQRRALHENIGWSLAVFGFERRGTWQALLSRLDGPDRADAARGLGTGLALAGPAGCAHIARTTGPDRAAMVEGARRAGGDGSGACAEL